MKQIVNNLGRYKLILCMILYKISLDVVYAKVVCNVFSYVGYTSNFSLYRYIVSFLFLFFVCCWYKNKLEYSVSELFFYCLDLIYFIPFFTLYSLYNISNYNIIYVFLYWIAIKFSLIFMNFKIVKKTTRSTRHIYYSVVIGTVCVAFIFIILQGFKFSLNFFDVYGSRKVMVEMLGNFGKKGRWLGGIYTVITVLIPVISCCFWYEKKYTIAIGLLILQMWLFSFGRYKKVLFFCFLVIVYISIKKYLSDFLMKKIVFILLCGNILSLIEGFLFYLNPILNLNKVMYTNLFIRRSLFEPVRLSTFYFDYFSKNFPDMLRQSIFRRFGAVSNYNLPIPKLIGMQYFGTDVTASNGICGDAFSNFGWYSLLFYPLMLVMVLKLMDSVTNSQNRPLNLTILTIYLVYFINGSFFSTLLSNGYLIVFFVLWLKLDNKGGKLKCKKK